MTMEEVKEAIRAQMPVRIRALSMMMLEEIEYKRIICILPLADGEKIPTAVLEDRCGHSVSYAKITQIIGRDAHEKEKASEAAYA